MQGQSRTTVTVGRSRGCDVVLAEESVSRVHAEVTLTARGRLYVNDRGSSQGTFVDDGRGRRAVTQQFVETGDRIWFGDASLSGAELLERVRSCSPRPARSASPATERGGETPRRPRWDPDRGEIREYDSRER